MLFKYIRLFLSGVLIYCTTALVGAQNPIEAGDVHWERSLEQAKLLSTKKEKPILILFQEIPGCSTCRNYGQKVLSHPLLVEAIDSLFIPLLIHNNKRGADKKTLQYFKEPAWNNPVVRIVDDQLQDLTPRIAGQYTKQALVAGMIQALHQQHLEIPLYLQLLSEELNARKSGLETTYFSMYCFWAGEKYLGGLKGVYSTTAGFMDGKEVVQVVYNPLEISYLTLMQSAAEVRCGDEVYTNDPVEVRQAKITLGKSKVHPQKTFKPDKTPKYYLSKTPYKYVQMTALQACRANSMIAKGQNCDSIFSPGQMKAFRAASSKRNKNKINFVGQNF